MKTTLAYLYKGHHTCYFQWEEKLVLKPQVAVFPKMLKFDQFPLTEMRFVAWTCSETTDLTVARLLLVEPKFEQPEKQLETVVEKLDKGPGKLIQSEEKAWSLWHVLGTSCLGANFHRG
jgi:hypothetical protein